MTKARRQAMIRTRLVAVRFAESVQELIERDAMRLAAFDILLEAAKAILAA